MLARRKEAQLIIKFDGVNHYQIEQALRSYCLPVFYGHWYLKRITAAEIELERRIAILLLFFSLPKELYVWCVILEESLCM